MDAAALLNGYDKANLTVGILGGHSALDASAGAKKHGFRTLVVACEGNEQTYNRHFRVRDNRGCIDDIVMLKDCVDVLTPEQQQVLRQKNTIFVQNRMLSAHLTNVASLEQSFNVPIFGSRHLLKLEDGNQPFYQRHLLEQAGIRVPKIFRSADEVNGELAIVKASEAERSYERAFFLITDQSSWLREGSRLEVEGKIAKGWEEAVIEEFLVGMPINFNFFYSPLTGELELLGTDIRRQSNLDGFLRMTAEQQTIASKYIEIRMIEAGHMVSTIKESLLEKAFDLGERFVKATQALAPEIDPSRKGIIGPFALQTTVVAEEGHEDIVVFDASFRMPGSPGLKSTPYMDYLYGQPMSIGERIGLELRNAVNANCLEKIIS